MAIRIGCVNTPELRAIAGAVRARLAGERPDASLHSHPTHYALCTALLDGELELALGYLAQLVVTVGGQDDAKTAMVDQLTSRAREFGLAVAGVSRTTVAPMLVMLQHRAAELQIGSLAELAARAANLRLGGPLPIDHQLWPRLGFGERSRPDFAELVPLGPSAEFATRALDQELVDVVISWNTEPVFATSGYVRLIGTPTAEQERLVALVRTGDRGSPAATAAGSLLQRLTAGQTAELLRAAMPTS